MNLRKANSWGSFIIVGLIILALGLVILLIIRYRKGKEIQQKYILLEEKFMLQQNTVEKNVSVSEEKKTNLDESKVEELLRKLKIFEEKKNLFKKVLPSINLRLSWERILIIYRR
ncbi:hypothetical protein [Chryseobacterium wanjuense]